MGQPDALRGRNGTGSGKCDGPLIGGRHLGADLALHPALSSSQRQKALREQPNEYPSQDQTPTLSRRKSPLQPRFNLELRQSVDPAVCQRASRPTYEERVPHSLIKVALHCATRYFGLSIMLQHATVFLDPTPIIRTLSEEIWLVVTAIQSGFSGCFSGLAW